MLNAYVKHCLLGCGIVLFTLCGCGGSADESNEGTVDETILESAGADPSAANATPEADGSIDGNVTETAEPPASDSTGEPIVDVFPSAKDVYPNPVHVVTATELAKAYEDRASYEEKYANKIIEVNGTVLTYDNLGYGSEFRVSLSGGDDSDDVFVELKEETPWVRYLPGSTLTVRGVVKRTLEIGGGFASSHAALVVSSDPGEVLQEYDASEFEAVEKTGKLADRWLLINGPIVALEIESGGDSSDVKHVYLGKGTDKQIDLAMPLTNYSYEHRHTRNLKNGDTVKVLAKYHRTLPAFESVFLVSPLPKLPQLPTIVRRPGRFSGAQEHLYFSADILGEWLGDPRALDHMINRQENSLCELVGEVLEVKQSDFDESDMYVQFKNSSDADIRYVLKKDDPELGKLKPGTTVTVRGQLGVAFSTEDHAYINK